MQLKPLLKASSYTKMQETFIQTEETGRSPNVNILIQMYAKQLRIL